MSKTISMDVDILLKYLAVVALVFIYFEVKGIGRDVYTIRQEVAPVDAGYAPDVDVQEDATDAIDEAVDQEEADE